MINVVFLLIVFFLLTATLAPPEPFAVDPPAAGTPPPGRGPATLHVAADGRLAFAGAEGEPALAAAAAAEGPLDLRADRALPAAGLARLLARLAALGRAEVRLVIAEER